MSEILWGLLVCSCTSRFVGCQRGSDTSQSWTQTWQTLSRKPNSIRTITLIFLEWILEHLPASGSSFCAVSPADVWGFLIKTWSLVLPAGFNLNETVPLKLCLLSFFAFDPLNPLSSVMKHFVVLKATVWMILLSVALLACLPLILFIHPWLDYFSIATCWCQVPNHSSDIFYTHAFVCSVSLHDNHSQSVLFVDFYAPHDNFYVTVITSFPFKCALSCSDEEDVSSGELNLCSVYQPSLQGQKTLPAEVHMNDFN